MYVDINKTRYNKLIRSVNNLQRRVGCLSFYFIDLRYFALNDKHVTFLIDAICRINNTPVFYQQFGIHSSISLGSFPFILIFLF